jgi:hypothetical protein
VRWARRSWAARDAWRSAAPDAATLKADTGANVKVHGCCFCHFNQWQWRSRADAALLTSSTATARAACPVRRARWDSCSSRMPCAAPCSA